MVRSVLAFDAFFRVQIIDGWRLYGCQVTPQKGVTSLARKVIYIQTQVVSLARKGLGASNYKQTILATCLSPSTVLGSQAIIHHNNHHLAPSLPQVTTLKKETMNAPQNDRPRKGSSFAWQRSPQRLRDCGSASWASYCLGEATAVFTAW
jgi:hypothetical protein